ncbi:MAG: YiiX/YebB-like N1pC/P60 family cysteine hydrolase [Candidatus Zixiibacteriota bacterium]
MRILKWLLASLVLLYLVLLIPESSNKIPAEKARTPFVWKQDQYWQALEQKYAEARNAGCSMLAPRIDSSLTELAAKVDSLELAAYGAPDSIYDRIEQTMFELGPEIGACREKLTAYGTLFNRLRSNLKRQSANWDLTDQQARVRLYRLLYGGRTAIEQIMLQLPEDSVAGMTMAEDVASATPSTMVLGVTIHSGDILVSRGGAPTSALIARGNDFPGNFSHIALAYVDSASGQASIVESHIERGVVISSLDEYLGDTKLRVMVLRVRPDLAAIVADPMVPHKAARYAVDRVRAGHVPYDFQMDYDDPSQLFCSEVASDGYRAVGMKLWMGMSHISSPGIRSWLGAFGVTHFETQEPSDLEYDPQLKVVAEWRSPKTLAKDQIDNAATDQMLEDADRGLELSYDWFLLPVARVLKAYSVGLNWIDRIGPVPEGMSATGALRNEWYSAKHAELTSRIAVEADRFRKEKGYVAPYWELVSIAKRADSLLN